MCAADISELFALSALGLSRIRVAVGGGVDVATRRREGEGGTAKERERESESESEREGRGVAAAKRGGEMSTAQLPEIPPQRSTAVRSVVVPCQTADGKWPRCGRGVELLQAAPPFIQDACPGRCP